MIRFFAYNKRIAFLWFDWQDRKFFVATSTAIILQFAHEMKIEKKQ